ncbi:MAG: hypothetical protein ABUT20_03935 [Bacteroidota bacterium]
MKKAIIFLLAAFLYNGLYAQENSTETPKRPVPNMATIKTFGGKTLKGWFYQMNDSGMVLLEKDGRYRKTINILNADKNAPTFIIKTEQIRTLTLQKKNSVMKGFLIGLGAGIVTGAIMGFASGDDVVEPYPNPADDPYGLGTFFTGLNNAFAMTAGQKAVGGAFVMGTMGALTGIVIGSIAKKKFIIGGSKKRVRDLDADLRQRLLIQ